MRRLTYSEKILGACAGLVLLALVTYANTLNNGFHLDDFYRVVDNPGIQTLHLRHFVDVQTMATIPTILGYRPLLPLSLSLNYALGGYDLAGYHLVNIFLHLASVLCFFFIALRLVAKKTLKALALAFFASALFCVHPVSGILVNYISARDLLMAVLFANLSFYFYLSARQPTPQKFRAAINWTLVFGFFALSLLSKVIAVMFPFLIFFYELTLGGKRWDDKIVWRRVGCLALVPLIYFLYTKFYLGFSESAVVLIRDRWTETLSYPFTQLKLHFFEYGKNFLWPLDLHQAPFESAARMSELTPWLGLFFLVWLIIFAVKNIRTKPLLAFCIFAYWLFMIPDSSLLPLHALNVHYRPYASSPFLYLGLSLVVSSLWTRKRFHLQTAAALALVWFMGNALFQNTTWKDEESLWSYSVEKGGASLAHLNYAMALSDLSLREQHLKKALEMSPEYILAKLNLGLTYIHQGKKQTGLTLVEAAVSQNPEQFRLQKWLNEAYPLTERVPASELIETDRVYQQVIAEQSQGRHREALSLLEQMQWTSPDYLRTGFLLGYSLQMLGEEERSISVYQEYLQKRPRDFQAIFNLAFIFFSRRDCARAIPLFEKTVELKPDYLEARMHMQACPLAH